MISETHLIDCMKFMGTIPNGFYDLAIADPEQGLNIGKARFLQQAHYIRQENGSKMLVKANYAPTSWDAAPATQQYFNELKRVSKHQIIWGINYFDWAGLGSGRIKWDKCVAKGASFNSYEYAYCSLIDNEIEFKYLWSGMHQAKSLLEPTTSQGNKKLNEKRIHPCQKPVNLYRWCLNKFAQPGQKIFDSHLGSQNSRIAAYDLGFDFYGCENDPAMFDAGNKSFEQFRAQGKLALA